MRKLVVFPNDPIIAYYKKKEIKPRYFNPNSLFDEVHIISQCDEEVEPEKVQEIVGNAKLTIHTVGSIFSFKRPWRFFIKKHQILNLVGEINPSVIRAYNSVLSGYLAAFFGKRLGIPSVLSLHSNPDEQRIYNSNTFIKMVKWIISQRIFEPYSLTNITKTICVSNFLQNYARKYGAKDIETIYNRVYLDQFATQRDYSLTGVPKILSVGRLDPPKNQECLIRAIEKLNVELTLIGNGINYDRLVSLTKELNISDRVTFIKSVPHKDIQKYYWDADIFAISSFYEGFCIPILEAMAAGLPVVVNDKEPLPEVLGGTGLVVKNTPEAFEYAFKQLISNPQFREELGKKAKERAVKLDGSIMEQKEAELYEKLITEFPS
jgi:glycosyltransferase involved in cell wall biosynthesis